MSLQMQYNQLNCSRIVFSIQYLWPCLLCIFFLFFFSFLSSLIFWHFLPACFMYICAYMGICACICMYVCMHIYIYIYIYIIDSYLFVCLFDCEYSCLWFWNYIGFCPSPAELLLLTFADILSSLGNNLKSF